MKILIVTDAFHPQVNGVVNTLTSVSSILEEQGHEITWIEPSMFRTFPLPTYPSIRIAWNLWKVFRLLNDSEFDAIHIATEGPLGITAAIWCNNKNIPFTSSYHTKFDEYVNMHIPIPKSWIFSYLSIIHSSSRCVLTTTPSMRDDLVSRGLNHVVVWGRGVDSKLFNPSKRNLPNPFVDLPKPIWLNVGRVSKEKNIESFLDISVPGTKIVIGDGPDLEKMKKMYKNVLFLGSMELNSTKLATHFAHADVFVFPSKTDTFGIVILEALSSGLPVAAYPVTGPIDIIKDGTTGCLSSDLRVAMESCLDIDNNACVEYAQKEHSWSACAALFLNNLVYRIKD